jgi:hypothetical protein
VDVEGPEGGRPSEVDIAVVITPTPAQAIVEEATQVSRDDDWEMTPHHEELSSDSINEVVAEEPAVPLASAASAPEEEPVQEVSVPESASDVTYLSPGEATPTKNSILPTSLPSYPPPPPPQAQ